MYFWKSMQPGRIMDFQATLTLAICQYCSTNTRGTVMQMKVLVSPSNFSVSRGGKYCRTQWRCTTVLNWRCIRAHCLEQYGAVLFESPPPLRKGMSLPRWGVCSGPYHRIAKNSMVSEAARMRCVVVPCKSPEAFVAMLRMRHLQFGVNLLEGCIPDGIAAMKALERLTLKENLMTGGNGLRDGQGLLTNIRSLLVSHSSMPISILLALHRDWWGDAVL